MSRTLLLCGAAVLLFACSTRAAEVLEDIFEQTYVLNADGTISINNTDGSIRVYAADVSEIHVRALKKAYTADRLNGITIDVKATPGSLVIDTRYPPQKSPWSFADRSGTVEYTLIVPMTTRISECNLVNGEVLIEGLQGGSAKAHLVNGWLAAHNCFADLDLSIVNGRLDVAYDWWQPEKTFRAIGASVTGTIRTLIPADASVAINAETAHGHVANTFAEDDEKEASGHSAQLVIGNANAPAAELNLRADTGNIRLDKSY